jgi:uncharacterized protein YneR
VELIFLKINIDAKALEWFEKVVGVVEGEYVRFTISYEEEIINRPYYPGFALRFFITKPYDMAFNFEINGITFYIEASDTTLFDKRDLFITYDEELHDIRLTLSK